MIRAGEISAYRVWRYYTSQEGGIIYLISYVSDTRWFPHRYVEVGLPLGGDQGIHGYKTMSDLRYDTNDNVDLLVARSKFTSHATQGVVIGMVDFWGEVWEHRKGYRAQYARPTAFLEAHGENAMAVLARLRADFKV